MESSRADQVRAQRPAVAKRELAYVHDVRYGLCLKAKFPKNSNQIHGGHDEPVRLRQNRPRAAKALQVIPRLTAVIVNDRFLPSQAGDPQRRRGRDEERPIGCRKNVRYIRSLQGLATR